MTTPFGSPFERPAASVESTLVFEPLGLNTAQSPLNADVNSAPSTENFIIREGRLEPRPCVSALTGGAGNLGIRMAGGTEVIDVDETRYLLAAGQHPTSWFWRDAAASWNQISYTTANGVYDRPDVGLNDYWDFTQIFYDQTETNIAVGALTSRKSLYCWQPGAAVFSTLTNAPKARYVAAFDNYLVAANVEEAGVTYPQRIRWSDRGSANTWSGGLSGYEDLLAAKGGITRVLPLENRIIVFFEDEIWAATRVEFPYTFQFAPLDSTIGCPFPWTATVTPKGIMFMARNFQVYLLTKEGSVVPVGQQLHRYVRDSILQAQRAWGVYDGVRNTYQFWYSSGGSGTVPQRSAWLQLDTGAWMPQNFESLLSAVGGMTRGFTASLPQGSGASTWDDLDALGTTWDQADGFTWDELLGIGNERQTVVMGDSSGTVYQLGSQATVDIGFSSTSTGALRVAPLAFWETSLPQNAPAIQKTVREVRVDYSADTTSRVSVRLSPDQGGTFATGSRVTLPPHSGVSQGIAYMHIPARYPKLRIESEDANYAIHRLHLVSRLGGR